MTILPGHFSSLDEENDAGIFSASLFDLKRLNYGLLLLQPETEGGFVRYLLDSLPPFVPEYVDIKRVNAGLLKPAEVDAWTLELGKNACGLSQATQPHAPGRRAQGDGETRAPPGAQSRSH